MFCDSVCVLFMINIYLMKRNSAHFLSPLLSLFLFFYPSKKKMHRIRRERGVMTTKNTRLGIMDFAMKKTVLVLVLIIGKEMNAILVKMDILTTLIDFVGNVQIAIMENVIKILVNVYVRLDGLVAFVMFVLRDIMVMTV